MKNLSFFIIISLTCVHYAMGQSDPYWIIQNSKGRSGVDLSGNSTYSNLASTSQVTFRNVHHPHISDPDACNDLFVIYIGGEYYSSRKDPKVFYPPTGISQPVLDGMINHDLDFPEPVEYAYLSKIYEGDEPPPGAMVVNRNPAQPNVLYTITPEVQTEVIELNHDITRNREATVIINNIAFRSKLEYDSSHEYRLYFDKILFNNGSDFVASTNPNFFSYKKAFVPDMSGNPTTAQLYAGTSVQHPGFIQLDLLSTRYSFFNLLPTNLMESFFPSRPNVVDHLAQFSIVDHTTGSVVMSHTEELRDSHDPNFVQVDKICRDKKTGKPIAFYTLQFENTSKEIAKPIVATLQANTNVSNDVNPRSWKTGIQTLQGSVTVSSTKAKFSFPPHLGVKADKLIKHAPESIGYVKFCTYLDDTIDWTDGANSLEPREAIVYFNLKPYPITLFYDLTLKLQETTNSFRWVRSNIEGLCRCKSKTKID